MREILSNILIEFGISMKLVRLIIMCLHEIYSSQVGKNLWYVTRSEYVWKKMSYHHCLPS